MNLIHTPTAELQQLLAKVSKKLEGVLESGRYDSDYENWKQHRIDTVHATMGLEGFLLDIKHVASVVEEHFSRGPHNLVLIADRVVRLFDNIQEYDPRYQDSLITAYDVLAAGIEESTGQYRSTETAIFRNRQSIKLGLPPDEVPKLMNQLFQFMVDPREHILIKAFKAHYAFEHIQPFDTYNGILGRFWQTLILYRQFPLLQFIPIDVIVYKYHQAYLLALSESEQIDDPAEFIIFMLKAMDAAMKDFIIPKKQMRTASDRIHYFHKLGREYFTRKDYLKAIDYISTATASRDLEKGVKLGLFKRFGTKNATYYSCQKTEACRNLYG